MDRKFNSLKDLGSLVPSTEKSICSETTNSEKEELPYKEQLEAHFSNKGRGGKVVTIITGFQRPNNSIKAIAKELKTICGVGGSVKNQEIIIQGNYRDKIMETLRKKGFKVKRVGG